MVNGDLYVDAAGRYLAIEGEEKCAQDIAESLLNNRDPEFPEWFPGSELYRITNGEATKLVAFISPEELIRTFVEDAVDRLIEMQDIDAYVDDAEAISEIRLLRVDKIGSLSYVFYLIVVTDTDDPIRVGFEIDLNQQLPAAIRGDVPSASPASPNSFL